VAGDKYALLVGAKGYENVPPLKWADKDACDVARELEGCGFAPQNMTVLHDGDAAKQPVGAKLYHHLGDLQGRLDPDDLLLFYFSGHGIMQDDDDYLLPIDASDRSLKRTAVKLDHVVSDLQASGSKQVVLLIDACRNELPTGKSIHALGDIAAKSIAESATEGVAAIFSCESRERSYEVDEEQQSAFTHCLLHAIRRPSVNTVNEVADYLASEVKVLNGKYRQRPQTPFLVARPDHLRNVLIFASAAGDTMSPEFEGYLVALSELYGENKITQAIFYDVWEFLRGDTHPPGPVKLVSDVCNGISSPVVFQGIWKHLRAGATPSKPTPAIGDLGSPARRAGS
jgi:Caspase domain